ncbi:hypothetical protein Tco_1555286 [Tanacetum coccineum]
MSTSKTYQQSLANTGYENRPLMLERGSYITWVSRFSRYLNRKRDNRKWLLKALDEGPYEFKNFVPKGSTIPRLKTAEDLKGDDLLLHDAEMEWEALLFVNMVNASRAKKLEKSHDPLALVHMGSSSRQTSSYYVTHPTSVVGYNDEYQKDDVHNNSEDPLVSAMLLLAKAIITQYFYIQQNNRIGNTGRNSRRVIVQRKLLRNEMLQKRLGNVQKDLSKLIFRQYFNCSMLRSAGKGITARMKLAMKIEEELNCKRASIFYTSPAEIQINDFCQDQVKPILNELKVYLEFFQNLFQRNIKEMKDVFESTENKILNAELEKVKKKSFEIQEGLQAKIKILEKDVQRCEKQKCDNAKMEYKKIFDSIKKTRSQTQKEMDELIVHVSEKTYAYGAIRVLDITLCVGQFCVGDLEVALFVQYTCYVDNLQGDDCSQRKLQQSHGYGSPKTVYILTPCEFITDGTNMINGDIHFKLRAHSYGFGTRCFRTRTLQRFKLNHQISSAEPMNTPSKEDLDNLFGPMFEEYYEQSSSDTPIYFAAQPTQNSIGLQFLGGKLMSWSSKKQDCTAMSTAEAEYVSLSACCAQVIWMRTQLLDYGYKYNRILMYCDSKSAIAISCNPVQHSKTKHIDIRNLHGSTTTIAVDVHPDGTVSSKQSRFDESYYGMDYYCDVYDEAEYVSLLHVVHQVIWMVHNLGLWLSNLQSDSMFYDFPECHFKFHAIPGSNILRLRH